MAAENQSRSYRTRSWAWLILVVVVAAAFWTLKPRVLHDRIIPACETCARPATTSTFDGAKHHAFCADHVGKAAPQEQRATGPGCEACQAPVTVTLIDPDSGIVRRFCDAHGELERKRIAELNREPQ